MSDDPDGIALTSTSHPVPDDISPGSIETMTVELPDVRRPPVNGTRRINDIGCGMLGIGRERMRDIRVYEEGGSVLVWTEAAAHGVEIEAMQYLNPTEAMAFAKAFERCAIEALKKSSE